MSSNNNNNNSARWIDVTADKFDYDSNFFVIPEHYEEDVSNVLIPHGLIMVSRLIWHF